MSSRGRGGNERRARAQLEESIDDSEARKNGKGVFGAQHAAGVERNQHERPHLEAARQRVRDREALQRQRRAEPSDADGEILRGRSGQGVSARDRARNATPTGQGSASEDGMSGHGLGRLRDNWVERAAA